MVEEKEPKLVPEGTHIGVVAIIDNEVHGHSQFGGYIRVGIRIDAQTTYMAVGGSYDALQMLIACAHILIGRKIRVRVKHKTLRDGRVFGICSVLDWNQQ